MGNRQLEDRGAPASRPTRVLVAIAFLAAAISLLVGLVEPAYAQQKAITIGSGNVIHVTVAPGSTLTITTSRRFADLVVGNATVADVVPLTEHSLYVQGKGSGATNISIYDDAKNLLGVIDVRIMLDFNEIRAAIRSAVPSSKLIVTNVNDRIRISGVVKDGVDLARVLEIAQQYSSDPVLNQVRVADAQQVMLEVRIIEASRSAGRDLGIGFNGASASGGLFTAAPRLHIGVNDDSHQLQTEVGGVATQNGTPFGEMIAKVLEVSGWRIDVVINALEAKGLVRRLAQPNLVTMSGTTASFHAGGEVPITRAVSAGGELATEISYRPYGVKLSFTPIVLDDGLINLVIEPEVSEIDRSVTVNGNPGFISRKANATVELRDGQSFAMAGLLQSVNAGDVQQMPWLGQVPVLGALFRSTSFQKRESDLVIVVTPRIVRPTSPDEKLHSPLDQTRPGNDVDMFLLGMLEVDKDMMRGFKDGKGVIGPYGHIIDLDFGGAYAVGKK
ncbi:type II and III secretion system protein family protein [Mesorhizobium sp. C120A]|uniref:type II and III secretion system protein family protein n=1 Tax=unclassified Mesorhizobium TaxID=325217 RepID=UPI0003D0691B|nr:MULTISPECIES: type II and III secretion system protein family protein [unclassified Mesorhizobium]ESZ54669.1 pilus assembly protein CpaC [Mesorhizobium sp. L103C120A0]WJI42665.1 type II and III secretion system protein family protein [Mesorhizobium sp. C120A]